MDTDIKQTWTETQTWVHTVHEYRHQSWTLTPDMDKDMDNLDIDMDTRHKRRNKHNCSQSLIVIGNFQELKLL
jgi:hypothetical protein